MDSREKARLIVSAALAKKALDPVVFETRNLTDLADYIVIVSGTSDRHVKAIAEAIDEALHKAKQKPLGIEGQTEGRWVLIDAVDVITHVFYQPVREYYALERLWLDAPRLVPNAAGTDLEAARAPEARHAR